MIRKGIGLVFSKLQTCACSPTDFPRDEEPQVVSRSVLILKPARPDLKAVILKLVHLSKPLLIAGEYASRRMAGLR